MAKITESLVSSIKSAVKGGVSAVKVSTAKDELVPLLKIVGKNFMTLPGIARDLNVARQNAQKLVKLEGGEPSRGADAFFLKQAEREKALEVQMEKEKPTPTVAPKKEESFISKLFKEFAPKKIMDALKLAFDVVAIGFFLYESFKNAFGEWAKTLYDSIKQKFDEFVLDIREWFNDAIQPIVDEVKNFVEDWIVRPVTSFFDKFANFAKSYFEFWANLITSPLETIGKVWNGFMSLVETAKQKFEEWKDSIVDYYAKVPEIAKKLVPAFLEKKFGLVETEEEKTARETRQKKREEVKAEDKKRADAEKKAKDDAELERIKKRAEKQKVSREETGKKIREEREAKKAPTPISAEPPKVPPPSAPGAAAPKPPPSPSDSKPVRISSETGKKAMVKAMDDYKVTDPTARAAIMAQVGHESGGFKVLSENLNYKPATLMKIFPKYFKTPEEAERTAAAGPKAIADKVYGGRMGNAPDEGFLYRGRGFIQLTGKNNYTKFGYASNPDAVATPEAGADTAMKYMMQYKGDWGDVKKVTKFVNGGYIGLEDRVKHFQEYLNDPAITKVGAVSTTTSGGAVSAASGAVASSQRQQAKPQTPIVINAPTTNTTVVKQDKTIVASKPGPDSSKTLSARIA